MKKLTAKCLLESIVIGSMLMGSSFAFGAQTLKLNHIQSEEVPVHEALQLFADKVNEYTNGELKVRIYPNAQLGNQTDSIEMLQNGAIDFAKTNTADLEAVAPLFKVFNLPYLFSDRDHYYRVLNGEIGTELLDTPKEHDIIGIAYYDAGSRSFYAKKPIEKPEDLQGLKVRVQLSPSAVRMVELLGGSPAPVSFDQLYTAMEQGAVDAAENNEATLIDERLGEIVKYYSRDEHTMIPDVLVMSVQSWNKLTPQEQEAIQRAGKESSAAMKDLWEKHTEVVIEQAQNELGVNFIDVDKVPFIEKVQPMYQEAVEKNPQIGELIERIKAQ